MDLDSFDPQTSGFEWADGRFDGLFGNESDNPDTPGLMQLDNASGTFSSLALTATFILNINLVTVGLVCMEGSGLVFEKQS